MRRLRRLLKPLPMLAIGLVPGTAARLFDIYFQHPRNIYVIDALLIYVIFFQKIPRLSRKGGNRA